MRQQAHHCEEAAKALADQPEGLSEHDRLIVEIQYRDCLGRRDAWTIAAAQSDHIAALGTGMQALADLFAGMAKR